MTERMPFGGEYVPNENAPKKGVKLDNKRSKITQMEEQRQSFDEAADEYMQKKRERNAEIMKSVREFYDLIKDKTLDVNKSAIARDVEKKRVADLVAAALELNQDETEAEGFGSIAIINLLCKISLYQRDRINEMSHELIGMKKQLSSLASSRTTNE